MAAGQLWRADTASAELDPPLVTFLDNPSPPPTPVEPGMAPQYRPAYTTRDADSGREDAEQPSKRMPLAGAGGLGCGVFIVIAIIRVIVGLLSGMDRTKPVTPSGTPPFQYKPGTLNNSNPTFTEDEIREFEQYKIASGNPMPPRYTQWIIAGKPKANSTYSPTWPPAPSYTRPTKLWTPPSRFSTPPTSRR